MTDALAVVASYLLASISFPYWIARAKGIDRGVYADVKDPACDLIFIAAEDWAAQTGWSPR